MKRNIFLSLGAILYAFLAPQCTANHSNMMELKAKAQFESLQSDLEKYKKKYGAYPSSADGLKVLLEEKGINTQNRTVKDPWGNPFYYQMPGKYNFTGYDLWSYGADNAPGGKAQNSDLTNWNNTQENSK